MALPRVGDRVPLVTIAAGVRRRRRASPGSRAGRSRDRAARGPRAVACAARCRGDSLQRRAAHEVTRLVELDDATQARLRRASCRDRARCRRAACRPRAAACRARPGRRARSPIGRAGLQQRRPRPSGAASHVDEQLEAVLTGVAGARDPRRRRPRRGPAPMRVVAQSMRGPRPCSGARISRARGPWIATSDGPQSTRRRARRRSPPAARRPPPTRSPRSTALGTTRNRSGPTR